MLVRGRMSSPVITVDEMTPVMDALDMMRKKNIRRTPVLNKAGKMVGIVSDKDLLNAGPSDATSLSVWEINYLLSRLKVKEVMTTNVLSVTADTPIEEAAYVMAQNKIGGLPVLENGQLVGLITETDLFKLFLELMGARDEGVRVTAIIEERPGELDDITHAISSAGGNFVALGVFSGDTEDHRIVTFKVTGLTLDEVAEKVKPQVKEITDIRICC
jgi:acetoin utilization protein AcuB